MSQKHLAAKALSRADCADYKVTSYVETLSPGVTFQDVFSPLFWAHHRAKLRVNDMIRLIADDRSFDIDVTVASIGAGGVTVELRGGRLPANISNSSDPQAALADAVKTTSQSKPVPVNRQSGKPEIRIDHTPRTKWRLIGLNGNVVKRDMEKAEAEIALRQYLTEMNMHYENDVVPDNKAESSSQAAA